MDEHLKQIQQVMLEAGFYKGKPDGLYGPLTETALRDVITARGLKDRRSYPWVDEIRKVLGFHEVRDNATLKKWLVSDGKTLGDPGVLPWCGDAMETAIKRSLPTEKFTGNLASNPYWALNWAGFGVHVEPRVGAIGVFKRNGGGHVGVLISQSVNSYHVLGGNQGDSVSVTAVPKHTLVDSRWPSTYPIPEYRPLPFAESPNAASLA